MNELEHRVIHFRCNECSNFKKKEQDKRCPVNCENEKCREKFNTASLTLHIFCENFKEEQ